MVALLLYALLELQARRAGLRLTTRTLLAQFAPVAVLILTFADRTQLRRLTGLAPPLAQILETLGWARTQRYLTVAS
jgi:hypothetical protein